jgi:hypothetical protein
MCITRVKIKLLGNCRGKTYRGFMKFGGVTRFVLLGKSISLDVELKENGY